MVHPLWKTVWWFLQKLKIELSFSSVQSLRHVQLFAIPWTAARQASLSITNCWSLPKPMSIELVMPSNHLILGHPLLFLPSIFPNIRVFQMSQLFASGGQNIQVSASTSVLPMNTQDWFPLRRTGWISLLSKEISGVFSNTTNSLVHFSSVAQSCPTLCDPMNCSMPGLPVHH